MTWAAIARALANGPSVILADEPTAALDTENGKNVMDLLKKLAAAGTGLIFFPGDQVDPDSYNRFLYQDGTGVLPRSSR